MTQNTKKIRVADMLVTCLKQSNVKRVYGLIGDSLNVIGDAIGNDGTLDWISVRHEESAAFAAGTEAFLTGNLGVCAGTCGPGSVHLINGLYEANRNNSPVLAIVTQFESAQIGLDYFQATHPERLFQDCSIFCEMLSAETQMPRLVQTAIQTAVSKRGVAVIIIPSDIATKQIDENAAELHAPTYSTGVLMPESTDIQSATNFIENAKNITFYCGYGCKGAMKEITELSEKLNAPIIHTIRSKEFIKSEFDTDVRGHLSAGWAETAIKNADLLIMLGTDYPYNGLLPTNIPVIQIDIDGSHIGRRGRCDLGIVSDVRQATQALLDMCSKKTDDTHMRKALKSKDILHKKQTDELERMAQEQTLRPEYLTAILNQMAPDNAIFLIDVGLNDMWANRYLDATDNRMIIGSFKHGTMGAAMPDAIGAALSMPKRPLIVLAGDGGLSMMLGDLMTIAAYRLPIKIIVYNNQSLGFINFEASVEGMKPFHTDLTNPDFADIAKAMGINSYSVDSPHGLCDVLQSALDEAGPVLINAWTNPRSFGAK